MNDCYILFFFNFLLFFVANNELIFELKIQKLAKKYELFVVTEYSNALLSFPHYSNNSRTIYDDLHKYDRMQEKRIKRTKSKLKKSLNNCKTFVWEHQKLT